MRSPDQQIKAPKRKKPRAAAGSPAPTAAPPQGAREVPRTALQIPARRPKSRLMGAAPRGAQRPAGWLPLREQYLVPLMPYGEGDSAVWLHALCAAGGPCVAC